METVDDLCVIDNQFILATIDDWSCRRPVTQPPTRNLPVDNLLAIEPVDNNRTMRDVLASVTPASDDIPNVIGSVVASMPKGIVPLSFSGSLPPGIFCHQAVALV
ncbi:MAG TPA: hypothetical protein VKP88_04835 [Candidatus Paceibacterota bacterium]|nr:hypothetical protein [Candidatus Paceibacterota bacterium]